MPKLHYQSQDYPGTTKHPGTPVSEYPRTPELHRQLQDYPNLPAPIVTHVATL